MDKNPALNKFNEDGVVKADYIGDENIIENSAGLQAFDVDVTLNYFIAKTDKLKVSLWNELLKLGEHEPFFYNWKLNGNKCAVSPDLNFTESTCKPWHVGTNDQSEKIIHSIPYIDTEQINISHYINGKEYL